MGSGAREFDSLRPDVSSEPDSVCDHTVCPSCGGFFAVHVQAPYGCHHVCRTEGCPNRHGVRKTGKWRNRRVLIEKLEARDGPGCFYCRREVPQHAYTLDHWVPRSRGGTRELPNLRLACAPCNQAKGAMTPVEIETLAWRPGRRWGEARLTWQPFAALEFGQ